MKPTTYGNINNMIIQNANIAVKRFMDKIDDRDRSGVQGFIVYHSFLGIFCELHSGKDSDTILFNINDIESVLSKNVLYTRGTGLYNRLWGVMLTSDKNGKMSDVRNAFEDIRMEHGEKSELVQYIYMIVKELWPDNCEVKRYEDYKIDFFKTKLQDELSEKAELLTVTFRGSVPQKEMDYILTRLYNQYEFENYGKAIESCLQEHHIGYTDFCARYSEQDYGFDTLLTFSMRMRGCLKARQFELSHYVGACKNYYALMCGLSNQIEDDFKEEVCIGIRIKDYDDIKIVGLFGYYDYECDEDDTFITVESFLTNFRDVSCKSKKDFTINESGKIFGIANMDNACKLVTGMDAFKDENSVFEVIKR